MESNAWGSNSYGRLGDGTTTIRPSPVRVTGLDNVIRVAAGDNHSLALTADGFVYSWGFGGSGQLGLGSAITSSSVPQLVSPLSNIVAIAAGGSHSFAVTDGGALYAWGMNGSYQLGDGTTTTRWTPTLIGGIASVASIDAGGSFSLATLQNGAVYAWGAGGSGQLGLGTTTNRTTPTPIPALSVLDVKAGVAHGTAIRTDGVLVGWGAINYGQVGDTTIVTPRSSPVTVSGPPAVALLSAGGSHAVAVTPDGHVWTWGLGTSGQLGDGVATRPAPRDVWTKAGSWGGTVDPVIDLASGTYNTVQTATVSIAMTQAVLHFTTSGDVPTEADPVVPVDGHIDVTGTMVLRVRAWVPGLTPSRVVSASYTLRPLTPTIAPPAGTYTTAQSVTLSSATEGASVRYTVDGADPTDSSTLYTGPVAVTTTMTLKAAAFRSGWTPSVVASAAYTFQYGTLTVPLANPASGTYPSGQQVTLSAPEGASIRYTLDGTDPVPSSTLYTAPLSFGVGTTTLRARAYQPDWNPSAVGVWEYTISTDTTPPTITAQVTPPPNAAGWNNTAVTITYTCSDAESGVATCPSPATLELNGREIRLSRDAVDNAGNRATSTVLVNIDRSLPVLTQYAPANGDVLPLGTPSLEVRGGALDALSGIALVTCNDLPAVLDGQRYTCTLPAATGQNAVHIVATDLAGNTTALDLTVTVDNPPPPTSIEITPAKMTLLPGETRQLRVLDQRKQPVSGGTFTVGNAMIAQVELVDNVPFVRGIAGGETTVTLTRDTLTAATAVTVLPEGTTDFPSGTNLWSLSPVAPPPYAELRMRGRVLRATPSPAPANGAEPAALFFVEHQYFDLTPARIVATTWDGRELWRRSTSEGFHHFAADNLGGMLLVGGDDGSDSEIPGQGWLFDRQIVRRLDGFTGAVTWEYLMVEGELSAPAVHPDGTVYVVESKEHATTLVALDGNTGGVRARISLTGPGREYGNATAPVVRQDGTVEVLAHRWKSYWEYENPETVLFQVDSESLSAIEHVVDTSTVGTFVFHYNDMNRIVPDAQEGRLLLIADLGLVYRVAPDYTMTGVLDVRPDPYDWYPRLDPQIVVGNQEAHVLVQSWIGKSDPVRPRVVTFNPVTLERQSTTFLDELYEQYLLHSVTVSGTAQITGPEWGNIQEVVEGHRATVEPAVALYKGAPVSVPDTESPYWAANIQGANAPPLRTYIYLQFKSGWDTGLQIDGLTAAERAVIQETARTTVEQAFKGYAVRAIVGTIEDAKLGKYSRRIVIDGALAEGNGETYPFRLESEVHLGTLFNSFMSALDCGGGNDCSGTAFGEIPQKTGVPREQLVTALGRGTGATAAHEMGHQANLFKGVRSFTFHTTTCENCYDYTLPERGARYPRVAFFGPLQWSEQAQKAMRNALPW